jgi:hypothetical protein
LIEAAFDELNFDIRPSWPGDDFVLPERRPTDQEIRETDEGLRLLAGFLIQRNADRVRASRKGDRAVPELHFQHSAWIAIGRRDDCRAFGQDPGRMPLQAIVLDATKW